MSYIYEHLKDGMFGMSTETYELGETYYHYFVIINDRLVYQDGGFEHLKDVYCDGRISDLTDPIFKIKILAKVNSFDQIKSLMKQIEKSNEDFADYKSPYIVWKHSYEDNRLVTTCGDNI